MQNNERLNNQPELREENLNARVARYLILSVIFYFNELSTVFIWTWIDLVLRLRQFFDEGKVIRITETVFLHIHPLGNYFGENTIYVV